MKMRRQETFTSIAVLILGLWSSRCWIQFAHAETGLSSPPPNIHAVIVSSSRYWFNYRHAMNALGMYRILQQNGIPDSQIILMIADEYATNPRNPFKNGMYANGIQPNDTWYSQDTELDYRGSDVTVQNFLNAVLGVGPKSLQHANEESNLLIFVTGHGGDQFFKFQDEEELTAQDIANLMEELARRQKFRKAVFIADTCQAFTLFDKITTPNVYALGTSLRNENAYAHHSDKELGLSVIERWTHGFLKQYEKRPVHPATTTLYELMVQPFEHKKVLGASVGVLGDFRELPLHEFFGSPPMKQKAMMKRQQAESPKVVLPIQPTISAKVSPKKRDTAAPDKTLTVAERVQVDVDPQSTTPSIEPTDRSFALLVGGLIVLVISASGLGKAKDDMDDTI